MCVRPTWNTAEQKWISLNKKESVRSWNDTITIFSLDWFELWKLHLFAIFYLKKLYSLEITHFWQILTNASNGRTRASERDVSTFPAVTNVCASKATRTQPHVVTVLVSTITSYVFNFLHIDHRMLKMKIKLLVFNDLFSAFMKRGRPLYNVSRLQLVQWDRTVSSETARSAVRQTSVQ